MANNTFDSIRPLPVWSPVDNRECFRSNMQTHSPFIVTQLQARSDLGQCIISTTFPRIVARIHTFRTAATDNLTSNREETARLTYLNNRHMAFNRARQAHEQQTSVRAIIEDNNQVYDEEFDEARPIAKVPGLNIYLELYGCLDDISEEDLDRLFDPELRGNVFETLDRMATWAPNMFNRKDRRPRATNSAAPQPLDAWQDDYDPNLRPMMTPKRGIGQAYVDPSRRPELLHSHAPASDRAAHGMVKALKQSAADLASQGIAPESYGEGER